MYQELHKPLFVAGALALALGPLSGCDGADAEESDESWSPSRNVEYVAPADPGGGWDTLVRTTSRVIEEEGLSDVSFAPINQPGGGGSVAWSRVASSAEDPHKLFATSPPIILVPLAGQSRYDHTDFQPIARLISDYSIVLVKEDSPYQEIDDLMDAISDDPGGISVGGGSAPGSMDHVSIAGMAAAAGLDADQVNYIPFSGGGEAMTNLMGGHVDAVITGAGEAMGQVEGDRLRALGVASPERLSAMSEVPTVKEQGVDYTFEIWRGVMGPKDMPDEAVAYYEQVFAAMVETERWDEEAGQLGWMTDFQDAEAFGEFLDEQQEEFADVLDALGLLEQ
ncbi:Bug family tripartite tricarboxylate transporter substrate binding protein [Aquisalimonas asiatica]|uniref:Putative tricarboxylic transport membrane protein n=1 Tax=Aquisalimonas asiatica TaxID=406100 RepID=A0A1H8T000_9GAMM|nr:tripartite tricarboxylate transporter substrate binding protein [Aquisalimonas asiatica]SEO83918.1 putative tricarboxylic transport membrane protein [Aquisalimonas asiatica]